MHQLPPFGEQRRRRLLLPDGRDLRRRKTPARALADSASAAAKESCIAEPQSPRAPEPESAMVSSQCLVLCSALLLGAALAAGQQRLLGGLQDASADEDGARRALQFAMNEYNRGSNDKYASRVAEVVRVRKQIVSGVNYFFDVKVGRTTCPKSVADIENCAFHESPELAKHVTCSFQVYSVPWTNHISLKRHICT